MLNSKVWLGTKKCFRLAGNVFHEMQIANKLLKIWYITFKALKKSIWQFKQSVDQMI